MSPFPSSRIRVPNVGFANLSKWLLKDDRCCAETQTQSPKDTNKAFPAEEEVRFVVPTTRVAPLLYMSDA